MTHQKLWRAFGYDLVIVTFVADQLSKWYLMTRMFRDMYNTVPDLLTWLFGKTDPLHHAAIRMTSFFDLVMVWNPGVSFGMLQTNPVITGYALSGFAVLVALGLLIWMWREPRPPLVIGLGLITGGALGNVWDRWRFGAVVDFLDFHLGNWHWPAFNVADSAITVGVILLLIDQFFFTKSHGGK